MLRLRRAPVFVFLLLLSPVAAWGQNGKMPIQATDLYKIRELSNVTVAPGGRSVVYTVKRVVEKPDSAGGPTYRTHLWRVDAGGRSAPQQLTFGEKSAYSPAWHPRGDRLAFVRPVDGTPQVFILPMTGGESYQITDAEHGATDPTFSPDGRRLLFSSRLPEKALREATGDTPDWPDERPGRPAGAGEDAAPNADGSLAEVRAYLRAQRDTRPRVFNRLDFHGERDLEPQRRYRHLFVVNVSAGPPHRAGEDGFPDATRITGGFRSFGGGSWTPDGGQVVVSGTPVTDTPPDRVRDSDLYLADTEGPGQRRLLSMEGHALSSPRVSPDGAHVAFSAYSLADAGYAQGEIGLYRLDGTSAPRLLTAPFDRSAGPPEWSTDGWHLYTTAPSEGDFPLYRISPFTEAKRQRARLQRQQLVDSTGRTDSAAADDSTRANLARAPVSPPADTASVATIERLTDSRRGVRSFDVSRASIFYVATRPENPFELYTHPASARRLTEHNATWLQNRRLSTPEPFTVQSDTLTIDGWTMQPTTERKGKPAPLLVEIHGGPMAMWGPGEATMWHEFQYFAAQGYALVYSNPRGSGGYGQAFKRANYRDWGHGPARDVLAAADYAADLDWTDASRQVLTGGSYAGYLTAWIVAHTDRFQAAVAQRGVYDLATFLGEGNAWRLVPYHFGGFPWESQSEVPESESETVLASGGLEGSGPPDPGPATEDTTEVPAAADTTARPPFSSPREALIQNSPITYADQIRTPLLIMHADEDLRTGVTQSEVLYKSLKILNRPVEYVRYPNAGHDLSRTGDPAQRLDRILRIWEFFERYI